jgi:hypothetical protein
MTGFPEPATRRLAYPGIDQAWAVLAEYLQDRFDPELTDFTTLRAYLDQEWRRLRPHFYERSIGYLYDLTFFHYMDAKNGFFHTLLDFATEHALTHLADIGCGIALDAQALLQAGFDVHAYDLANPSLAYARWRLHRDLNADHRVHTLSELPQHRYEIAYAVDVLGHTDNPDAVIQTLFAVADHVAVNVLPHDRRHRHGPDDLHPHLNHARVLPLLQRHGVLVRAATSAQSVVTIWRTRPGDAPPVITCTGGEGITLGASEGFTPEPTVPAEHGR